MVASRQAQVSFCGGIVKQRGSRLGALAQTIGRTASAFLR